MLMKQLKAQTMQNNGRYRKKMKFQKLKRSSLVQDVGEIFYLGQDELGYLLPILHNFTELVNVFEI